MKSRIPTKRQEQALQAIHVYADEKGFPPTISELRSALKVASDQAILELLGRLERGGYITREAGQARGIKITPRGYTAIGAQQKIAVAGTIASPDLRIPLELTPRQQLISEKLSDIHPKLAQMYAGVLHTLKDPSNPDRIAQSAHSMREITAYLSKSGEDFLSKEEEALAKGARGVLARKLEKVFDPLGGVRHLDQNVYDTWNREFHQFFVGVAHHREVSLDEYLAKLSEFEELLLRYVFPLQVEIYDLIDGEIAKGPENIIPFELKLLLSRNVESYAYFLKKVDARWLEFLNQHGLLRPSYESAEYLSRIAPDKPEAVMDIILATKLPSDSMWVKHEYIKAAGNMPVRIAVRLIARIRKEKWIEDTKAQFFGYALEDLLKKLISEGRVREALDLVSMLLDVRMLDAKASTFSEVKGFVEDYQYSEILRFLLLVSAQDLKPFIQFLVETLCKAIHLEARDDDKSDYSYIWRPAIEDHEQNLDWGGIKESLVSALRTLLEKYTAHLVDTVEGDLGLLLNEVLAHSPSYPVLTRLKLHVYRLYPDRFTEDIGRVIFEAYDNINLWHEYALLLEKVYPELPKSIKDKYFQLIATGPTDEAEQPHKKHWIIGKLAVIKKHLTGAQLSFYRDLLEGQEEPEHVDFHSYSSSWEGPTSPLGEKELSSMDLQSLLKYLLSWNPDQKHWAPSRQGLGREFAIVVKNRAQEFSASAFLFADPNLRPVYLYHFFSGLLDAFSAGAKICWKEVLRLGSAIVERAQAGTLPEFALGDDWEADWGAVFQWLAKLLEDALRKSPADLSIEYRSEIWKIISFICEHPDPNPEHEAKYGGNNSDPFTMSLNSVRGQAFHALFTYVFWCNRNKKTEAKSIPPEVRPVLEKHLEISHDPSLTVRSVYGRYFPWLLVSDYKWTRTLIPKLFPKNDRERRYAAWEPYLTNAIFGEAVVELKSQYEWAIDELGEEFPKRRYFVEPKKRLAEHMVIIYAYNVEKGKDSLVEQFFKLADSRYRGMAVSFAGRAYLSRENQSVDSNPPDFERLKNFWEWRLKESEDVQELKEFGWWMTKHKLDNVWLLQMLIKTLTLTRGVIAGDFLVMDTLAALAEGHAKLCATALQLILLAHKSPNRMFIVSQQKEIEATLLGVYKSGDDESRATADKIVDYLTKSGFERYRLVKAKSLVP